jgi:hypothetical protein
VTWRSRLPMIGGLVLFGYLLVWMLQLVLLYNSPESFDRAAEWWASLGGRLLACGVLLAAVYHLLEGLLRAFRRPASPATAVESGSGESVDHAPVAPGRASRLAGLAVPFLTFAVVVPGWAVLLRPWLDGTAS